MFRCSSYLLCFRVRMLWCDVASHHDQVVATVWTTVVLSHLGSVRKVTMIVCNVPNHLPSMSHPWTLAPQQHHCQHPTSHHITTCQPGSQSDPSCAHKNLVVGSFLNFLWILFLSWGKCGQNMNLTDQFRVLRLQIMSNCTTVLRWQTHYLGSNLQLH